ncbi:MAG: hypothetical protein AVDCRST_MAG77-854 [uncultured Chloroflexi bacterium]|uniref:Uncharacterized protein n=1 Tax=uncultured Chloroflexota bacterium TaxID=166587 RepID=A0A6J4HNC0_9CHLR|nr:MAG: hypothetical protein AVDCRST_MAG77-854 [uncultured Chloroflexota bacterium]
MPDINTLAPLPATRARGASGPAGRPRCRGPLTGPAHQLPYRRCSPFLI